MNDSVRLIRVDQTTDSSGTQQTAIISDRVLLCDFRSVGMKEAYTAMSVGRNPEIVAVLSDWYDYDGEQYAAIDGHVYKILRTYRKSLAIELTLERTRDLEGLV